MLENHLKKVSQNFQTQSLETMKSMVWSHPTNSFRLSTFAAKCLGKWSQGALFLDPLAACSGYKNRLERQRCHQRLQSAIARNILTFLETNWGHFFKIYCFFQYFYVFKSCSQASFLMYFSCVFVVLTAFR